MTLPWPIIVVSEAWLKRRTEACNKPFHGSKITELCWQWTGLSGTQCMFSTVQFCFVVWVCCSCMHLRWLFYLTTSLNTHKGLTSNSSWLLIPTTNSLKKKADFEGITATNTINKNIENMKVVLPMLCTVYVFFSPPCFTVYFSQKNCYTSTWRKYNHLCCILEFQISSTFIN